MNAFREESEEHVVRRLEAFSDIVIGFALAESTLSLILPNDPAQLFTKYSASLGAFAVTFVVVCGMWWSHHRLFTHYFVPTRLNIVLNFTSLGGVVFLIYTLQVWIHAQRDHYVAYGMYSLTIGWIMAVIAFLTFRGVALRGAKMDAHLATLGRSRAIGVSLVAVAFTATGAVTLLMRNDSAEKWLFVGVAILLAAARTLNRMRDRSAAPSS